MKANREVREDQFLYHETMIGTTWHVRCTHAPSGFMGKATIQGSRTRARGEARDDVQAKLEARWLP